MTHFDAAAFEVAIDRYEHGTEADRRAMFIDQLRATHRLRRSVEKLAIGYRQSAQFAIAEKIEAMLKEQPRDD